MSKSNSGSESEDEYVIKDGFLALVMPSEKYEAKLIKNDEIEEIKEKPKDEQIMIFDKHEEKLGKLKVESYSMNFGDLDLDDDDDESDDENIYEVRIIVAKKKKFKNLSILKKSVKKKKIRITPTKDLYQKFYYGEAYDEDSLVLLEHKVELEYFKNKNKFLRSKDLLEERISELDLDSKSKKSIVSTMIKQTQNMDINRHILERINLFGNIMLKKKFTSLKLKSKYVNSILDLFNESKDLKLENIKELVTLVLKYQKKNATQFYHFLFSLAQQGKKEALEYLKTASKESFYDKSEEQSDKKVLLTLKENILEIFKIYKMNNELPDLDVWKETIEKLRETFEDKPDIFKGFEEFFDTVISNKNTAIKKGKNKTNFYSFLFKFNTKVQFEILFENILKKNKIKFFLRIMMDVHKDEYNKEETIEQFNAILMTEYLKNKEFIKLIKEDKNGLASTLYKNIPLFKNKIYEAFEKLKKGQEAPKKIFDYIFQNELFLVFLHNQLENEDSELLNLLKECLESITDDLFNILKYLEEIMNDNDDYQKTIAFIIWELITLNYEKIEKTNDICKIMTLCVEKNMVKMKNSGEVLSTMLEKLQNKNNYLEILKNFKILYEQLKDDKKSFIDKKIIDLEFDETDMQNNYKNKKIWFSIFKSKDNLNAYELKLVYNLFKAMHTKFKTNKNFSQKLKQETFLEDNFSEDEFDDDDEEDNDNKGNQVTDNQKLMKEPVEVLRIISDFNRKFFSYFKTNTRNNMLEKKELKKVDLKKILGKKQKTKSKRKRKKRANYNFYESEDEVDEEDSADEESGNESGDDDDEDSSDSECKCLYISNVKPVDTLIFPKKKSKICRLLNTGWGTMTSLTIWFIRITLKLKICFRGSLKMQKNLLSLKRF
jgi:hypothetical protein